MDYEFKIGDRIVAGSFIDGKNMRGRTGTIICVDVEDVDSGYLYGIEFDEPFGGHDCDGKGRMGYCRYSAPGDELIPMDTEINTEQSKELDAFILSYEVK